MYTSSNSSSNIERTKRKFYHPLAIFLNEEHKQTIIMLLENLNSIKFKFTIKQDETLNDPKLWSYFSDMYYSLYLHIITTITTTSMKILLIMFENLNYNYHLFDDDHNNDDNNWQ